MDLGVLDQLERLLRPLMNRVTNMVARSTVQRVNDAKKQQMVQLGVQATEDVDDCEHFQAYGFSSVPLDGSEAVVLFPDGDHERPWVVVVADRRYRPRDGEAGEVTVYNHTGAKCKFTKDGDIELTPAAGRLIKIGSSTAVDGAIKGTQRNTAEQTFLTAMGTFAAAISTFAGFCVGPTAPQLAALTTAATNFATAVATFSTAATAAVSAKVKVE